MPRMRILSPSQQEAFDKPPLFDPLERQKFLNPSKTLLDIVARFRTPSGKIGFLLMAGYFKATKQFYQPQDFHQRDVEFVARQLRLEDDTFPASSSRLKRKSRKSLKPAIGSSKTASSVGITSTLHGSPLHRRRGRRKTAQIGIWNGRFVYPWDWRKGARIGAILNQNYLDHAFLRGTRLIPKSIKESTPKRGVNFQSMITDGPKLVKNNDIRA